jgi:predicted RNA-binding Zn-ribbon protein involved in translation (DUF1610 family)
MKKKNTKVGKRENNKYFAETGIDASMVVLKCPDCNETFGVRAQFMEKVSEVNYKYTCPYCESQYALENN